MPAADGLLLLAAHCCWLPAVLLTCPPPSHQGMSDEYAYQLEQGASLITWAFIVEMGVKTFGLG